MSSRRLTLNAAVVVILIGCGKSSLPEDHLPSAPHSIKDILVETGAKAPSFIDKWRGRNLVVGTLDIQYDDEGLHLSNGRGEAFRMALMIVPEEGEPVRDFFRGIPLSDDSSPGFVYKGDTLAYVPKLFSSMKHESNQQFGQDFPQYIDTDFELTFKEFRGHSFALENVPPGRAYIWWQTEFDGNRIIQHPYIVELQTAPGEITRHDILATKRDSMSKYFYFL